MNKSKYLTIILLLFSASLLFSQEGIKELRILHWNDFHSRNLPYKASKKIDGETVNYIVGGSASLLGYLNKYRDNKSLVVHAGDDFQGTPISSLTKGFSQIQLLNHFNIDAFTLGNHEFDYSAKTLDSALKIANFKYLGGNLIYLPEQKSFADLTTVKEINGIKIGIIGITSDELRLLTVPKNVEDIYIMDNDFIISYGIKELKNNNCDLIILLTHCGVENDSIYATKFYGDIDVIVGGHSHTTLRKPKLINNVIIAQAGSGGKFLGNIELKVDTDLDTIIQYKGELIETVFDSLIYDKNMQALVDNMEADVNQQLSKVIGTLENDWKRFGINSNLGQWEADVFRAKTNSDIAFVNSGGLRKELMKGEITLRDIWEISPFGNTINTIEVSGKLLFEMLLNHFIEAQKENEKSGDPDFLIVSGLNIIYDKEKLKNKELDFFKEINVNGEKIDENKTYKIATNNYIATQVGKFFGKLSEELTIAETNIIDRDVFIEAVENAGIINSVSENRIVSE
ncbi:MAG: 5'-nucleotidase C-terminal domain-containing protein [Ignavibacteria bacterium]|nr:5'-nucleotidase C-terminal domain-containing protein [Ignavibacteria bacterium]